LNSVNELIILSHCNMRNLTDLTVMVFVSKIRLYKVEKGRV